LTRAIRPHALRARCPHGEETFRRWITSNRHIQQLVAHTMSRLNCWKEIATHFGCSVATAQRWERDEGLPVHRHFHKKISTVFAYCNELDAWLQSTSSTQREPHAASSLEAPSGLRDETLPIPRLGRDASRAVKLKQFQELGRLMRRAFLDGSTAAALSFGLAQLQIAEALDDRTLVAQAQIDLALVNLNNRNLAGKRTIEALSALRTGEAAQNPAADRRLFVEVCLLRAMTGVSGCVK
jgi:hypothetical protein